MSGNTDDASKVSEISLNDEDTEMTSSKGESRNKEDISDDGSRCMKRAKISLLALLAVTAAVAGTLTYVFISKDQADDFELQVSFLYLLML
jgi:hypothetical protein